HETENDICSLTIQPGGRPLASDDNSAGVVNLSRFLPEVGQEMGTSSSGSLCLTQEQEVGTLRIMETSQDSISSGCSSTPLAIMGTPLDMSTMESNSQDSTPDSRGENSGDFDNTAMGGSIMVPDSQSVVEMRSSYSSAEQSLSRKQSLRQRARPEPKLGSKRVEYRRSTLLAAGASEDVTSLIFDTPSVIRRNKSYEQVQLQFEKFTTDSGRDPNTPDPISVMNFLAH
ncbi:hypothetical protein BGZ49_005882, partial [Haplosporangium sp. Z 27]